MIVYVGGLVYGVSTDYMALSRVYGLRAYIKLGAEKALCPDVRSPCNSTVFNWIEYDDLHCVCLVN